MLWGYGKSSFVDAKFYREMMPEIKAKLPEFQSHGLMSLMLLDSLTCGRGWMGGMDFDMILICLSSVMPMGVCESVLCVCCGRKIASSAFGGSGCCFLVPRRGG